MSRPSRCQATTLKAKKCPRKKVAGSQYCTQHKSMFVGCVDVAQKDAVYFPTDEGGPGLLEEVWELVGVRLKLFDLRSLYLTCKTLFSMFTYEDKWFKNHPIYVHVTIPKRRGHSQPRADNWEGPQDGVTEEIHSQCSLLCRNIVKITLISMRTFHFSVLSSGFANLSVISSYEEARRLFRLLRLKMHKEKLLFDGTGAAAEKYIMGTMANQAVMHLHLTIEHAEALKRVAPGLVYHTEGCKLYFET